MAEFDFFAYPPGSSLLNDEYLSNDYEIESKSEKKVKGTFWINPSLSDVKIDINNIVEWKYYTVSRNHKAKLTYSIENEKEMLLLFLDIVIVVILIKKYGKSIQNLSWKCLPR